MSEGSEIRKRITHNPKGETLKLLLGIELLLSEVVYESG